jgi:hypothetical protein
LRYYQTDTSTVVDGSLEWIIDNFNIGLTDPTIKYILNEVGTYYITLNEYESDDVLSTVIKRVIVNDVQVKADFIAHSYHDYAIFENNFSGAPIKLTWDFGDGQTEVYRLSDFFHDYDKKRTKK